MAALGRPHRAELREARRPQGSQSPPEEQTAPRPPPGALSDAPLSWGGESSGGRQRKGARGGEGAEFAGCRSPRHGGPGSLPLSSLPRAGSQPPGLGAGSPPANGSRPGPRVQPEGASAALTASGGQGQRRRGSKRSPHPPGARPLPWSFGQPPSLEGAPRAGVSAGTGEWGLELGIYFFVLSRSVLL